MSVGPDGEEVCEIDTSEGFTEVQFLFRAYLMPITYLFGIVANFVNVVVFTHKQMRSQLVNWFFLALSISDILVLFSSFFVFSLPVYAEYAGDPESLRLSALLIVYFYPIAQTSLTMSVYLTILVSTHRYLGVCHPFLIRRISNRGVVQGVILFAVLFACSFNIPRWFELTYIPCKVKPIMADTLLVIPTEFMVSQIYTYIYRNMAYTAIMFFLPFTILTLLNIRIVVTLHNSHQLRRQMTVHVCKGTKSKTVTPSDSAVIISKAETVVKPVNPTVHEKREHGVTIMLVAITTEFLLFNLLAFANNILELSGLASGNPAVETWLVEISALLVNINGASTIVIYMVFGSKYRAVVKKILHDLGFSVFGKTSTSNTNYTTINPNETTQLLYGPTAERSPKWNDIRSGSFRKELSKTNRLRSMSTCQAPTHDF